MEVIYNIENIRLTSPSVITVGTFDGVHLGHMEIINKVVSDAREEKMQSVLVTFNPHPQNIVKNRGDRIYLLTTPEEKLEILKKTKLDKVIFIPFTSGFSKMDYGRFLQDYLVNKLNMKKMVLGYDAALGHKRQGHLEEIKAHAAANGYVLDVVTPFEVDGVVINSTLIRKLLLQGDYETATKYLGRHHIICGKVVRGDKRGTKLGFPTANIYIPHTQKLIPRYGAYAVKVNLNGEVKYGMMNVGFRPTFHESNIDNCTIEVHVFDFNGDLYDKNISVEIVSFIRDEKKFDNDKEIIEQLKKDKIVCKEIFKKEEI